MVGAVLLVLVLSGRFLFFLLVLADVFLPFMICLDGGGGGCGELVLMVGLRWFCSSCAEVC